jgi:hypothetical protein
MVYQDLKSMYKKGQVKFTKWKMFTI